MVDTDNDDGETEQQSKSFLRLMASKEAILQPMTNGQTDYMVSNPATPLDKH